MAEQLHVTTLNQKEQLYIRGLEVVENPNTVKIGEALYICRDGYVALSTGRKTVLSLVKSGVVVEYIS